MIYWGIRLVYAVPAYSSYILHIIKSGWKYLLSGFFSTVERWERFYMLNYSSVIKFPGFFLPQPSITLITSSLVMQLYSLFPLIWKPSKRYFLHIFTEFTSTLKKTFDISWTIPFSRSHNCNLQGSRKNYKSFSSLLLYDIGVLASRLLAGTVIPSLVM